MVSTYDKLPQKRHALAAQGVSDVMPESLFVNKIANWLKKSMTQ